MLRTILLGRRWRNSWLARPEARIPNGSKEVLKDPVCDTDTLSPGNAVCTAVVDANVHARIDDFVFGLRKAGEAARLLHGVLVCRGQLKIQLVGAEEKPQHMRNRAADGSMT